MIDAATTQSTIVQGAPKLKGKPRVSPNTLFALVYNKYQTKDS